MSNRTLRDILSSKSLAILEHLLDEQSSDLLTIDESAQAINVRPGAIAHWIRTGLLQTHGLTDGPCIKKEDLDQAWEIEKRRRAEQSRRSKLRHRSERHRIPSPKPAKRPRSDGTRKRSRTISNQILSYIRKPVKPTGLPVHGSISVERTLEVRPSVYKTSVQKSPSPQRHHNAPSPTNRYRVADNITQPGKIAPFMWRELETLENKRPLTDLDLQRRAYLRNTLSQIDPVGYKAKLSNQRS